MASALILIECTHLSLENLVSELVRIGVDMIYKVTGSPYDVILKLSANSKKELRRKVTQMIQLRHVISSY
jgi:DNA-binding Lrp family transcriptional regulator